MKNGYKIRMNLIKFLFLVNFYFLVPIFARQQGNLRLNLNNLIYTYQNLMGQRTKNRQIMLNYIQNSYPN